MTRVLPLTAAVWIGLTFTLACEPTGSEPRPTAAEPRSMSEQTLQRLFAHAVESRGETYVEARNAILEHADAHPAVDLSATALQGLSVPLGWQTTLTSQFIEGWHRDADAYRRFDALLAGNLDGPKPMGEFTAPEIAAALAAEGTAAGTWSLELLWKVGVPYGRSRSALFGTLTRRSERRALNPMRELLATSDDSDLRTSALQLVADLGDPAATDTILALAADPREVAEVRRYALVALADIDDPRAVDLLTATLNDEQASPQDVEAAAQALSFRFEPSSRQAALTRIERDAADNVLVHMITLLSEVGTLDDIEVLNDLRARFPEEVDDAVAEIRRRGR